MLACSALAKQPSAACGRWWLGPVPLHPVFVWCVACVRVPLCPARRFVCRRCVLRCLICVCALHLRAAYVRVAVLLCMYTSLRRFGLAWLPVQRRQAQRPLRRTEAGLQCDACSCRRWRHVEELSYMRHVGHPACIVAPVTVALRRGACGHAVVCLVGTFISVGVLVGCMVFCGCM